MLNLTNAEISNINGGFFLTINTYANRSFTPDSFGIEIYGLAYSPTQYNRNLAYLAASALAESVGDTLTRADFYGY